MKRILLSAVALVCAVAPLACGGEQARVKTPQERLEEEMLLAEEQTARQEEDMYRFEEATTDSERAAEFDEDQANIELTRAARSAKDCPASLPPEDLKEFRKGVAKVTLTFSNEGRVKDKSVSHEYADTPVGNCVLRAMGAVIVPVYHGPEKVVEWDIELEEPEEPKKASSSKKK